MVGNMFFILMEEREDSAGTVGPRQSTCLSPTESVCECEFVKFSLFKWQSYGIDRIFVQYANINLQYLNRHFEVPKVGRDCFPIVPEIDVAFMAALSRLV